MRRNRVVPRTDEDTARREEEHAASEANAQDWVDWRAWKEQEALDLENEEAGRRPWPLARV